MIFALLFGDAVVNVVECDTAPRPEPNAGYNRVQDITACVPRPRVGDELRAGRYVSHQPAIDVRAVAVERINQECGQFRAQFITAIPAQETVYQFKSAEVNAWDAMVANSVDPMLHLDQFPFLASEAGARGITVAAMRDMIAQTRAQWVQLAVYSETKRQALLEAVRLAPDDQAVQSLFPIQWAP